MSIAIESDRICEVWEEAVFDDSALSVWISQIFGDDVGLKTFIGFDVQNKPGKRDCPYVVLVPGPDKTGPAREVNEYEILLILGVIDERVEKIGGNANRIRYPGYATAVEMKKLVLDAISAATPQLPIIKIETERTAPEAVFYELAVFVTVAVENVIGRNVTI